MIAALDGMTGRVGGVHNETVLRRPPLDTPGTAKHSLLSEDTSSS